MKYKVGDKVRIKDIDIVGTVESIIRGQLIVNYKGSKIPVWPEDVVLMESVEEEIKPKFKVGDKITNGEITFTILRLSSDRYGAEDTFGECSSVCFKSQDEWKIVEEETKSEDELLDDYEELTDRAFKGGYEKCKSDIELNGFQLPEGYIFKDENGNEILTNKIILEKVNTLKTKSDNMEIETHRGYYTTEEETTNKSKKLAWFSFFDSNFADKVELDLSNRELIQEDGKWFVVKKKKEYPKTYEECCKILEIDNSAYLTSDKKGYWSDYELSLNYLIENFRNLLICRDAYWKIAGEEMELGKPWEPDWNDAKPKYTIVVIENKLVKHYALTKNYILAFPTEEMRDAFYDNFKEEIENCKELL